MKNMKFPAGTYIELDDMAGKRRVAMICKDGVTFWDVLDSEAATPIALHPSMNAVELGSFVQFSKSQGLDAATQLLVRHLHAKLDNRVESNPLFVMRALWFIAQNSTGAGFIPDENLLSWACEQAHEQEQVSGRIHELAAQYCTA